MHRILILALLSSCSWFAREAKVAEQAAIDCAKQDLGATVAEAGASILMTVSTILFEGGADWQGSLAKIASKYGDDAVACAAKVAEALFRPAPGQAPSTDATAQTPHDRAAAAVAGRRFK